MAAWPCCRVTGKEVAEEEKKSMEGSQTKREGGRPKGINGEGKQALLYGNLSILSGGTLTGKNSSYRKDGNKIALLNAEEGGEVVRSINLDLGAWEIGIVNQILPKRRGTSGGKRKRIRGPLVGRIQRIVIHFEKKGGSRQLRRSKKRSPNESDSSLRGRFE